MTIYLNSALTPAFVEFCIDPEAYNASPTHTIHEEHRLAQHTVSTDALFTWEDSERNDDDILRSVGTMTMTVSE
jgi:hypothetical protein